LRSQGLGTSGNQVLDIPPCQIWTENKQDILFKETSTAGGWEVRESASKARLVGREKRKCK